LRFATRWHTLGRAERDHVTGPEITIVMPARNEAPTIRAAIDSVLRQQGDTTLEVIVAEGGSDDGTRAVLEGIACADRRVRIVDNPDGITARGLNLALDAARGNYWVRVDCHSEVPPDYAVRLVEHLRAGTAEAAGAVVRGFGETAFGRAVAAAHDSRFGIGNSLHHHTTRQRFVDHVSHGAYRTDLSRRIGGFDPGLIRNQDYDFDYRYGLAGGRIMLDPTITFSRRVRETPGALARQYHDYGYWKSVVLRRHPRSLHLRWLAPPALVSALVTGALLSPTRRGRLLLGVTAASYGGFVMVGAAALSRRSGGPRALDVALALTTMHLAWGAGFLRGCLHPR
jgi:glycosyltransferase involved in cell wall biosynthesis